MNDSPTVFVPHLFMRKDPVLKTNVPTINLLPAAKFGDLCVLTSGFGVTTPDNFGDSVSKIRAEMVRINEGDFIAMVGDPTLCGVAIHEALKHLPKVMILRWDRTKYIETILEA